MTNIQLDELLKANIEIEGLIRVMLARPTEEAEVMLKDRLVRFASLCGEECASAELPEAGVQTGVADEPEAIEMVSADESQAEDVVPEEIADVAPDMLPRPVYVAESDDIRVDEMLSRREARDLAKAFTLNDKFRFIRELFCNNKESFDSALSLIMRMNTLSEAEVYLYNDMQMDADDPTVQDFMAIVTNHFNGR